MYEEIRNDVRRALEELIAVSALPAGALLVIGCSSSEVLGARIGHGSSPAVGAVLAEECLAVTREHGIALAAQCCEHLNRALIMEREEAERRGYPVVCVLPQPKAGGSFAHAVWHQLKEPVAVEAIRADAGLDIGLTMIGMHLKSVVVPVRLRQRFVGSAIVTAARTRPKYIGGARAVYPEGR